MRGKYKAYLFERFENYGTIETKDVYTHLDNNVYTIEHIMPQHLTPAWVESLGVNAVDIHATWLHRLANLTLTGYNPNLSNKSFIEKRDSEEGGYKASGLKMNQKIANKDSWGLAELEKRNTEMIALSTKIWALPQTDFVPAEKEFDSCTLDDENFELTGRDIAKYSYQNTEQPVSSWADMFEHIVKFLHQKDKSILSGLAYSSSSSTDLFKYVSSTENDLRSAIKIDDSIFVERNTSTSLKMSILRRLFVLYDADPMDLVFYLKDEENEKAAEEGRHQLRKKYWTYAIPIIQQKHQLRGSFNNSNPTTSNTLSGGVGISGLRIDCVANYDFARIDFVISKGDVKQNKEIFDVLYSHKYEVESELGIALEWERANENKASWISYYSRDTSITNEDDWERMANFHAEWSDKICSALLPYLQENDEEKTRLQNRASMLRQWTIEHPAVNENLAKCNRTYTRFTTDNKSCQALEAKGLSCPTRTGEHTRTLTVKCEGGSAIKREFISLSPELFSVEARQVVEKTLIADTFVEYKNCPRQFNPLIKHTQYDLLAGQLIGSYSAINPFVLVTGSPGQGKSDFLMMQAILRADSGDTVFIYDQTNAFCRFEWAAHMVPQEIIDNIVFWDLSTMGWPIDLLDFRGCEDPEQKVQRLSSLLKSGTHLTGPNQISILQHAVESIIYNYEQGNRDIKSVIEYSLKDTGKEGEVQRRLTSIFSTVARNNTKPYDWEELVAMRGKIIVFSAGNAVVKPDSNPLDIVLDSFYCYKDKHREKNVTIILDEVQRMNIVQGAPIDVILSTSRKMNISAYIATQRYVFGKRGLPCIEEYCGTKVFFQPMDSCAKNVSLTTHLSIDELLSFEQGKCAVVGSIYSEHMGKNVPVRNALVGKTYRPPWVGSYD